MKITREKFLELVNSNKNKTLFVYDLNRQSEINGIRLKSVDIDYRFNDLVCYIDDVAFLKFNLNLEGYIFHGDMHSVVIGNKHFTITINFT